MWVFSKIGFFSATLTNPSYRDLPLRQQVGHIMVRARVRQDLVRLIDLYQALHLNQDDSPEILDLPGHDYPYRVIVTKANWTKLVAGLAEEIDYSNFKSAVERSQLSPAQGKARHDLYMRVWSALYGAERWLRERVKAEARIKEELGSLQLFDPDETQVRGLPESVTSRATNGREKLSKRPPKRRTDN